MKCGAKPAHVFQGCGIILSLLLGLEGKLQIVVTVFDATCNNLFLVDFLLINRVEELVFLTISHAQL